MPQLIVIDGHPASGKSTLAQNLSRDLEVMRLSRDEFKETLYDTLGADTLADAKRYGPASFALLLTAAARVIALKWPLIIEANFSKHPGRDELWALARPHHYQFIEIRVEAPPAVLATRFQRRIQLGMRHPGHHDAEQLMEQIDRMRTPFPWLELGGPQLGVDTSEPTSAYYPFLVEQLKTLLGAHTNGTPDTNRVPHE